MALTREERRTLEEVIKRVRKMEQRLDALELLVAQLQDMLARIDDEVNMADWTSDQWDKFLEPFITKRIRSMKLPIHNHTTDAEGGPAYAKLGATLVAEEDLPI